MEDNSDPKHKDNKVDPIQTGGLVVAHSTTDDSVERDGYKDPKFVVGTVRICTLLMKKYLMSDGF